MANDWDERPEKKPRNYAVGRGKPPEKHRFKKGQSGNPKGRKPRVKNMTTLILAELDKEVVVREGDREVRRSKREVLVTSLVNDAITNKPRARAELLRVLDIAPPAEPFIPNDDDEALLQLLRQAPPIEGVGAGDDTATNEMKRDEEDLDDDQEQ